MSRIMLFKRAKVVLHKLRSTNSANNCVGFPINHLIFHIREKKTVIPKFNYSELSTVKSRCISNCCLMKTKDSDATKDDGILKAKPFQSELDDEEFQNILQVFTKDFGIENEANKITDDMKQMEETKNHLKNGNENLSLDETAANEDLKPSHILAHEKFKEFVDKDASVIYSHEEELPMLYDESEKVYHIDQEDEVMWVKEKTKRGIFGVFDVEELVAILRKEKLRDISVISIPKSLGYADYLVLVTVKSPRHARALTEFINKLYKMKKHKKDPFVKIEGEKVFNWKVIDMGNIVLHTFLEDTRSCYDIESLWLFTRGYDSGGYVQPDPMLELIEKQMVLFNSLDAEAEVDKDIM